MLCELQFAFVALLIIATVSTRAQQIIFGDHHPLLYRSCLTNENRDGLCRNIHQCPKNDLTGADKFPKLCGFVNDKTPVICCPLKTDFIPTNKSSPLILKEVKAPAVNFECGHISSRTRFSNRSKRSLITKHINETKEDLVKDFKYSIMSQEEFAIKGGIDVEFFFTWPWMALFGRRVGKENVFFCDGALINERYVLTAAHCVLDLKPFFVRLGELNYEIIDDSVVTIDIEVETIKLYPEFKLDLGYHDLALIKLANNVHISSDIKPVCLPWGAQLNGALIGNSVTVTGWGAKYYGGPPSPILQEAAVEVFHPDLCHNPYLSLSHFRSRFPQGMNLDNILCAGDKEGGKDACQGDSGGPLVHFENGTWTLAGIVSKGFGCGHPEYPGLYAPMRNLEHLQWIKDVAFP